jgi:hypothetical protein
MRLHRLALCAFLLPLLGLSVRAQEKSDDDKQEQQAPEEIPNFNQLDEYVYVPKSTMSLGSRLFLKGPKLTYSGQGSNPSIANPGDDSTVATDGHPGVANIARTYIDGTVSPDQRTVSVNAGLGGQTSLGINPDGRTNTWSYDNANQLLPDGNIAFHTYSAEITDTGSHTTEGAPNVGIELILDRDMGKLGKKIKWSITAGFSIADIHASTYQSVPTDLTTVTDTYDLFGQVPPSAPFSSPNTITQTVFGQGSTVTGTSGASTATQTATQTILLGNQPIGRDTTVTAIDTTNRYFTEGAYYTLRVGPTIVIPISSKFSLNASAGPALIYSGETMNVLEDLYITTGEEYFQLYQHENTHILPGYYVDVNLEYQFTDTAGFYVGSIWQGAGSFTQTVASGVGTEYTSRVDFGSQEGVKGGMTVRF